MSLQNEGRVWTVAEISAFTNVDEGQVRKDVEFEVVESGTPPRFRDGEALYFLARGRLPWDPPPSARRDLARRVSQALRAGDNALTWGPWSLDMRPLRVELEARRTTFDTWVETRTWTRDDILGGETAFRDSRLSVRLIGALVAKGGDRSEILADYPYLTETDLDMAALFARARPRRGRPSAC